MGSILKTLFYILLALIILVIAIPLLWLVIKEVSGLFGGSIASMGSDVGYIIFVVICIVFIIWALATWNN
jgi:hypothetical protein